MLQTDRHTSSQICICPHGDAHAALLREKMQKSPKTRSFWEFEPGSVCTFLDCINLEQFFYQDAHSDLCLFVRVYDKQLNAYLLYMRTALY